MESQIECWRALDEGKTLISINSKCRYYAKDNTVYKENPSGQTSKSLLAFSSPKDFRIENWWENDKDKFFLVRDSFGYISAISPRSHASWLLEAMTPLTKSEILSYAEHAPE